MKLFKKVIAVLAIATMSLSMVACGTSKAATEMGSKDEKGLIVARVGDVPIYKTTLENEKPVRTLNFTQEQKDFVNGLFLLTTKPVIYVANISYVSIFLST